MLDVCGDLKLHVSKSTNSKKLKHKITLKSRNKICILNFLRIEEGEEAGFLLNTDSYFKYMLQITVCLNEGHSYSPAMSVPAFLI